MKSPVHTVSTTTRTPFRPAAALVWLLLVSAAVPAGAGELLWPVNAPPAVSSNFCEYREGHLHAGLDIRTAGADGMPCLASGDGYVSRLRASSNGYGKALYVQLDSGQTLVYAHLAEFRPDLEKALLEEQIRRGSFKVSVRYPRDRFRVSRGEVIAWSGSTGGVPPHLHFEIRDRGENPLNPFAHGFDATDAEAPVFERIQFLPFSAATRIGGICWPVEPRIERVGPRRYALADTLRFAGRVGVTVDVFDRLNGSSGRLAPYRIRMAVEDSTLAEIVLDRFSFSHAGDVAFLYDMLRVRSEKSYFFQLFENPGESMWNRRFVGGGTLGRESVRAATGRKITNGVLFEGRVVAGDIAGNQSILEFRFYLEDPNRRSDPETTGGIAYVPSETGDLYIRNDFVSARGPLEAFLSPSAARRFGINGSTAEAFRIREAAAIIGAAGQTARGAAYLYGVEAGREISVDFPRLDLQLFYSQQTLFADAVQIVRACETAAGDTDEISSASTPVCIGPLSTVLREDVEIRFEVDNPDSTFAVYRMNEKKGEWIYYPSDVTGGTVATQAKRPGRYCVFSDRVPPRISRPVVGTRTSYATGAVRPEIAVAIEDSGAGVDYEKTSVSIDGVEQIFYWDGPRKKLFVVVHDDNIIGRREISVIACDKTGNQSSLDSTIQIPGNLGTRGDNQ
jgi:hypothetical protein